MSFDMTARARLERLARERPDALETARRHYLALSDDARRRFDATAAAVLRDAAYKLNTLWAIEAGRGLCDSLDSAEYQRVSLAPRLRAMAEALESAQVPA